jgi:TP901 family phage tail tape measure protein
MVERVVKVTLAAQVNGYLANMQRAEQATRANSKASEDASAKFERQNQAMTQIGLGLTAFGAVAATAVGLAVAKFAEFDQAMSYVQAATQESAENMQLLRDAALDAGARTIYSATEAANAIEELAKAGVSTADILSGGLDGALDLAAAGGLAVADAAGIAATALKTFGLEGADMAHVADLLAAGAGKAMGDVTDLSAALNQSAQVANNTGLSIEETTAALSAFASQGLLGSDAGTSFKSMLQRLTPQSAEAKAKMDELGISAYDASGQFIGLSEFAGNLQQSLKSLTPEQRNSALATIFGADAVRAASVLYDEGADGIGKWEKAVNDSGYASKMAAQRLNNLSGDFETLSGAIDTAMISAGEGANGPLRFLVQMVTQLVDGFNEAPPVIQQGALALTAVAAAAGLAGGAFLLAIPKVAEFQLAVGTLAQSDIPAVASAAGSLQSKMKGAGEATGLVAGQFDKAKGAGAGLASFLMGPWGVALAAALVGTKLLGDYIESLRASTEEYQNVIATAKSADDLFEVADKGRVISQLDQATESAKTFQETLNTINTNAFMTGLSLPAQQLKKSLMDIGDELGTVAKTNLPEAQRAFDLLAAKTDGSKKQLGQLLDSMPAYKDALVEQATSQGVATEGLDDAKRTQVLLTIAQGEGKDKTLEAADAYLAASEEVGNLDKRLHDLMDAINESNGIGQDAISANADYQESLAGISTEIESQKKAYEEAHGSLDGFNISLDQNTASGASNAAQLASVAASAQAAALAQYEVDKTTMGAKEATDKYVATLAEQRRKWEESAVAAGYNKDQVKALADQIFALPSAREVELLVDTANATRQINDWVAIQNGKQVHIAVGAGGAGGITKADGGIVDYYANGGIRENHVAQIAPAGSYRVWAESETGGESYIPLSPAKRNRSLQIWQETGKRLGVTGFADGGMTQYAPPSFSNNVNVAPMVSLAGATITAVMDGKPIQMMITDQIAASDSSKALQVLRGKSGVR